MQVVDAGSSIHQGLAMAWPLQLLHRLGWRRAGGVQDWHSGGGRWEGGQSNTTREKMDSHIQTPQKAQLPHHVVHVLPMYVQAASSETCDGACFNFWQCVG